MHKIQPSPILILSSSGILVTNLQSPFLSFYSNDFEFFPVPLGQELTRIGKFPGFSFGGEKVKIEMKGISNAHWAAEAPSCQEQGRATHITIEKYFLMNFQTVNYKTLILNTINSH